MGHRFAPCGSMENYKSIELELEIFFFKFKPTIILEIFDTCQKRGHVSKTFSETRFLLGSGRNFAFSRSAFTRNVSKSTTF